MKKTAFWAAVIVALVELSQHATTLAQFRWCPRC